MSDLDPRTPVLVGAGIVTQREDDASIAEEPLALMLEATRRAGHDSGRPDVLGAIDQVLVPVGRWRYRNPGGLIADAVGASNAESLSALPGVSQQTLLSTAASRIAAGDITVALVVGGEAGHRLQRARATGVELRDTESTDLADVVWKPDDEIAPAHERLRGLGAMPVGYYAVIDSAWRHAQGRTIADHRRITAERYHRFSEIASTNEYAWDDEPVDAEAIVNAPMLAFPYTRHHVSNWSVDQASALLLTSVGEALRRRVPPDRWVFPHAFSEANHMVDVSARGDLHRCVGAELAARAVLDIAGCGPDDLDFVELYSCFPIATEVYADALGLDRSRDWTFTGAMPFAGGPYNNFVLHATAQLVDKLRSAPGTRGMVTTVSGVLTKQGFAVWGADPAPNGYQFVDVTAATAATTDTRAVDPDYEGSATIAGYTVVHDPKNPPCGVVVVDLPDGRRGVAASADEQVTSALERREMCGHRVQVSGASLAADGITS